MPKRGDREERGFQSRDGLPVSNKTGVSEPNKAPAPRTVPEAPNKSITSNAVKSTRAIPEVPQRIKDLAERGRAIPQQSQPPSAETKERQAVAARQVQAATVAAQGAKPAVAQTAQAVRQLARPLPPAPGSPAPGSADKQVIPRTKQDEVQRPITSPSTTGAIPGGASQPVAPGQKPGAQPEQVQAAQQQVIPGSETAGSALAQGPPGEGVPVNASGLPMTAQEQVSQLQQQVQPQVGDTSGFLSGNEAAKTQENMRRAQPSPVKAVPQGTYEQVVKDDYTAVFKAKTPLSPRVNAAFKADAHKQLEEFGDWPMKGDHGAPPPPIRPGGRSFNPYTGKFSGERGPNAFKLMGIDLEKFKADFYRNGGK